MGRLIGIVIGIGAMWASLAGSAWAEDKVLLLNSSASSTISCSRLGCERIDFTNSATFDVESGEANAQKIQEWAETLDSSTPKFLIVDDKYAIADHDDDGIDILWPEIYGSGIITIGRSDRAAYLTSGVAEGGFDENAAGFYHVGDGDTMICYPASHADLDLRLTGAVCQTTHQLGLAIGDDLLLSLTGATYDHSGNAEGERHLSKTGAFASYTWTPGDYIFLYNATGGVVNDRLYRVESKVDSDAILLSDSTNLESDATGISSAGAATRAKIGLLIRNTATAPHGAKIRLSLGGYILGAAVKTDFVGTENHADNILVDLIDSRYCSRQIWSTNGQAVGWVIVKSHNDGSLCKTLFDFETGGDLTCLQAYHPNGCLLKIGPNISDNASYFNIVTTKLDAAIGESPEALTLDCEDTDALTQVEIGGSYSTAPNHQMIRVAQAQNGGQPDVQLRIKQLNEAEQRAYPIRPYRGAYMPKPFTTSTFASTVLWFDPDTVGGWTPADPAHNEAIQTIADRSGSGNDVTQATSGDRPRYNKNYGINWRPSVDFTTSITGTQKTLSKATPVDVADGFMDLTVMAVFCPRQVNNDQDIVQCQDTDATDGFVLGMNNVGKAFFAAGTAFVLSTEIIEINRPYLIIGQRDGSTGDLFITVNGVRTANTIPASGAIGSVSGNLNIGGRLTSGTWSRRLRGHLGEIFIDEAFWDMSNPNMSEWPDSEAIERVDYLRGAWGVW